MSDVNPEIKQLAKDLEPAYCPNCAEIYSESEKDVKRIDSEHSEQVRWHCFCGSCGAIYTIECEP